MSTPMTTAELPYEIWLHILRFLDTETTRQLHFVNALLYNIWLDEHHAITQIGYPSNEPSYAPLRDPRNSRRVRVLLIRNGPIYPQKDESPKVLGPIPSFWKLSKKFNGICDVVRLVRLLDAMPGLKTLTTLDVYLPSRRRDPFHWMKRKVLTTGWPIFSANLTILSLDVPLEEIHFVMPSHVTLPRLESFSINLHNLYPTPEPNKLIRRTLVPFLIIHGPTLRSLKLYIRGNVDTSSFLTDLPHMPHLRKLVIYHLFLSLELTSFVGHHMFLKAHQSQLQHLGFEFVVQSPSFDKADEFFNQGWCRVLLPNLQFLSFRLSGRFSSVKVACEAAAVPYFQRQISTLKSLEVHSLCFSYDQVASIITESPARGYRFMALRALDMQIQCFSPDILSLLADRVSQLQSLKLTVINIGPNKQPNLLGRNQVTEFCKALKSRCFPDWGLHDIDIIPRHVSGGSFRRSFRTTFRAALFHTLPNLKQFCGLGPNESWPEEQCAFPPADDSGNETSDGEG